MTCNYSNYSQPRASDLSNMGSYAHPAGSSTCEAAQAFAIIGAVGDPSGLMLEATLSVDPDHSYISLPSRTAVTLSQFKEALAATIHELETALETNAEFIQAIETARVEPNSI